MRSAVIVLISGFVALFAAQGGKGSTADFDDHVRRWVERRGQEVGRQVSWWDLYGKHQHLQERPQYHRFQISARSGPMRYDTGMLNENDKPQQVYSKWFCNYQTKQPMTTTISRELQRRAQYTWMQENGLKIGVELSMKATIPEIFLEIGASFSTELDFRGQNTEVKEETETFKIKYDLTIDPQTAVRADWVITEREVQVPYELDVYVEGYGAVWFDNKVDGHWLWFYPTSYMAGGPFRQYGSGLQYQTSGIFSGVRGVNSVIEAREYPLDSGMASGQCGGYGMVSHYDGLNPIKVQRIPMPLPSGELHGE